MHIYDDPGVCSKTSCIQIWYGLWVNLAEIAIGMSVGFSAVAIPQFKESDSVVATPDELAWFASVLTLSSPLGCLICGLLIDRIGRRMMQIISQLPMAIGWWYTALSVTPTHLIIGRVITGVAVGMSAGPIRIYTTEIALANMRGVLGAFNNVAISIGITATAAMGVVLKWTCHCYICGLFSALLMIINYFLPETPYHVLMRDTTSNFESTRRALVKFRSKKHDIDGELERLIDYKRENEIRRITLWQKIKALFQVSTCKPFFIIMPYILVAQFSGISVMMYWTIDILEASNLGVDNIYLCNVGIGVTRIISGIITSVLLYRFGRRAMALISAVGVSMVCFGIGGYLATASSPAWYPLLGQVLYMLFASLGYYTLPLLIMYELYPLLLRGFLGGITVSISNLLIFSTNKMYPVIKESIGIAYTFITFGVVSLIGTLFLCACLPETKGLTLQEIEEFYSKKRPTLISERKVYSAQWISRSQQAFSSSTTNVGKTKSLEHHKVSATRLTPTKLATVTEEIDMHHKVHEAPNFDIRASDDDIKYSQNNNKSNVVAPKKDNDNAETSDTSTGITKKDSLSVVKAGHNKYISNDEKSKMSEKEDNKNVSGARTIDSVSRSGSNKNGEASGIARRSQSVESLENIESTIKAGPSHPSRNIQSTKNVEQSKNNETSKSESTRRAPLTSAESTTKRSNLPAARHQEAKSLSLGTDSNDSVANKKQTKQEEKDRKRNLENKEKK